MIFVIILTISCVFCVKSSKISQLIGAVFVKSSKQITFINVKRNKNLVKVVLI